MPYRLHWLYCPSPCLMWAARLSIAKLRPHGCTLGGVSLSSVILLFVWLFVSWGHQINLNITCQWEFSSFGCCSVVTFLASVIKHLIGITQGRQLYFGSWSEMVCACSGGEILSGRSRWLGLLTSGVSATWLISKSNSVRGLLDIIKFAPKFPTTVFLCFLHTAFPRKRFIISWKFIRMPLVKRCLKMMFYCGSESWTLCHQSMKTLSIFSLRIDRLLSRGYYDKVCCNHLKLYTWVALDTITIVCKHHYYLYVNFSSSPVKIPSPITSDSFSCPSLASALLSLCGLASSSGNTQHLLCVWFISVLYYFQGLCILLYVKESCFPFYVCVLSHCILYDISMFLSRDR